MQIRSRTADDCVKLALLALVPMNFAATKQRKRECEDWKSLQP